MTPAEETIFEAFPAQLRFIEAFFTGKYNRMLLAGSIRSGKTYVVIAILMVLAKMFPRSKWVIVRKDWPKLRSTTMEVFKQLCPPECLANPGMPVNMQTKETVFKNGSRFLWVTEPPSPTDKFSTAKGLYINGAFPDEADGLHPDFLKAIKSRLGSFKGSWAINAETGEKVYPPACLLMTCNPNQGHLKEEFYLRSANGSLPERHYFQNLTIEENPYITAEDMEEFKDWEEDLFNKFIKGSWDAMDEPKQLIPWKYINQCSDPVPSESEDCYLGVDCARQGGDKLVYFLIKGSNIETIEVHPYTENTMEIVARIEWYITEYCIDPGDVVVDGVGIGAGVVDRLWEKGIFVTNFIGNAAPTVQEWSSVFKFKNLKAQGYWLVKECLKGKELGNIKDPTLKSELASIWKSTDEKEIAVDSKEKYRLRNGKSPDLSDGCMYATFAKYRHKFTPKLEPFSA